MPKILGLKVHHKNPGDDKPRISAVDWWRIINPYTHVSNNSDWQIDFRNKIVEPGEDPEKAWEIIADYDLVVSSYMDTPTAYAYLRASTMKYGTKLIMDLDDNIFDVDEMNPARVRYYPGSEPLKIATKIVSDVPNMTVSTKPLGQALAGYRQLPTFIMPNFIDPDVYRYESKLVPDNGDDVIIGYQGSATHYTDIMATGLLYALRRIARDYPNTKFYFVGCVIDDIKDYIPEDRLIMVGGERDHGNWVEKIWKRMPVDIGLAPLIDSTFNRGKSSIKYYEYSTRKIPGVYSFVEPYISTVKENRTGFLARDEEEFYEKISWLVENRTLRKKMGDEARKDVLENYTIQKNWPLYKEMLDRICQN